MDNPQGDVLFGIDNNLLSRANDANLFEPYESPGLATVDTQYQLDQEHRVTPIDRGDVCLNFDREYFASRQLAVPQSLDDLTKPEYKGLLVVENPSTSTPGLAFLLATVAQFMALTAWLATVSAVRWSASRSYGLSVLWPWR